MPPLLRIQSGQETWPQAIWSGIAMLGAFAVWCVWLWLAAGGR